MLYNLYTREPNTLYVVLVLAIVVLGVELLYFERDRLEREIDQFGQATAAVASEE
jgi:hypothetical protein